MSKSVKTVNERMLDFLTSNSPYNTFTVDQARRRFGVTNVAARIHELRQDGHPIYTNVCQSKRDGRKIKVYRYGNPTQEMKRIARNMLGAARKARRA